MKKTIFSGLDYVLDAFEESIRDVMEAILNDLKGPPAKSVSPPADGAGDVAVNNNFSRLPSSDDPGSPEFAKDLENQGENIAMLVRSKSTVENVEEFRIRQFVRDEFSRKSHGKKGRVKLTISEIKSNSLKNISEL